MIELKYKSWRDITISVFEKLKDIKELQTINQEDVLQKNVQLLSILCECEEDEIINLKLTDFNKLINQIEFLNTMPKVNVYDYYEINGNVYQVNRNIKEMTTSQYIDFQTLMDGDREKNLPNILAIFLTPKGKKYCDGYDVVNVIEDIHNHLSIVDARSIMFFFILQYQSLTKVMLTYSIKEMKRTARKQKSEKIMKEIKDLETQLTQVNSFLKNGNGFF